MELHKYQARYYARLNEIYLEIAEKAYSLGFSRGWEQECCDNEFTVEEFQELMSTIDFSIIFE